MRLTRGGVLCVLAVWCAPFPAHGQDAPAASRSPFLDPVAGLGLDDALARARQHEPGLLAARSEVDGSRGRRQQAGLRPNPMTTFEARREPGGTDSLVSIGVEWPLDLFRRAGRVGVADHQIVASQLSADERERTLAADVRSRYGRAAAAIRDADVASELAATVERQHALLRARAEEGAAPRLEADLLEVELRGLQAERALAHGRAERSMLELKPLLGMAPDERLALRESLDALVAARASAPASMKSSTVDQRPDVRLAREQVAIADATRDQAARDGRLDLSLFGGYMRMDAGFPQLGLSTSLTPERVRGQFHYVSGGVTVTLPLLNRNQGLVAAATGERAAADARRRAVELAAGTEIAAADARDRHARQAVAAFSERTRALARRNLEVVRQTFELGRATVFDVMAEQRRYLAFEQACTAVLLEAWEADAELRRATGELK